MKKLFRKSIHNDEESVWAIEEFIDSLSNSLEYVEEYEETKELYEEVQELIRKAEKIKEELENEVKCNISTRYTDSYDYNA